MSDWLTGCGLIHFLSKNLYSPQQDNNPKGTLMMPNKLSLMVSIEIGSVNPK